MKDLLFFSDNRAVSSPADWSARRDEIRSILEEHCYGTMPPAPSGKPILTTLKPAAPFEWEGVDIATYAQYQTRPFADSDFSLTFEVYTPLQESSLPHPAVICGDGGWMRVTPEFVRLAAARGYALVVFNRTQAFPDFMTGGGVGTLPRGDCFLQRRFPDHNFGAVCAWAWGFSRIMDALALIPPVDFARVAVCGHSRGGKASLLAGAFDTRFAAVVSNASGTGGSGTLRNQAPGAEPIGKIVSYFPNWFALKFATYAGREDDLPFDSHFVKALCAPRPLLCAEALDDLWANPSGCAASSAEARKVWRFLGAPEHFSGLRFRNGKHGHLLGDWEAMYDFLDHTILDKAIPWDPVYTPYD